MRREPTTETNIRNNYVDLLITGNTAKLEISVLSKPTSNETTINIQSYHPLEHKIAAYRFHIERMFTLPLAEQRQEEWESIEQIARKNNTPISLLLKLKLRIRLQISQPTLTSKNSDTKWAKFTYNTPHIGIITNIFKQTNVKIEERSIQKSVVISHTIT